MRYQLITHKMLSFAHRSAEKKKLANWETAEVAAKLPVGTWEAGKEHSQRHFVQLNREPLSTGERVRVGLGVIVEHFPNRHGPPKRHLSNMVLLFLGRSSLMSCCDRGKEHNLRIKTDDSQIGTHTLETRRMASIAGSSLPTYIAMYHLRLLQLYTLVSLSLSTKITKNTENNMELKN